MRIQHLPSQVAVFNILPLQDKSRRHSVSPITPSSRRLRVFIMEPANGARVINLDVTHLTPAGAPGLPAGLSAPQCSSRPDPVSPAGLILDSAVGVQPQRFTCSHCNAEKARAPYSPRKSHAYTSGHTFQNKAYKS